MRGQSSSLHARLCADYLLGTTWKGRSTILLDRQSADYEIDTSQAEAAERAGAIVTEQIRAITDAAQQSAAETRRSAEEEAEATRQRAAAAASTVLEKIDALESQLGTLVASLRREADTLTRDLERRGRN